MSVFDEIMEALDQKGDGTFAESFSFVEVGDTVVGEYVGKDTGVGQHESNVYVLEDEDGKKWSVWGGTVIDDRMEGAEFGDVVGIRYMGKVKNWNNYTVVVKPAKEI